VCDSPSLLIRNEPIVKKTLIIILTALAIASIISRSAVAQECSYIPPPILIDEPNISSTVSVSVTLEWNQVTDPEDDPVEYYMQVDDLLDFSSPYEIGWLTEGAAGCDGSTGRWTLSLATNKAWYWRVKARDANNTDIVSPWSFDSFAIYQPPSTPVLIPTPDTTQWFTNLRWNAVTCPDGDPVRYVVQVDNDPNFGSPDFTSAWTENTYVAVSYHELPIAGIYCWRVRSRDNAHTVLLSPWSAGDCFNFQHGY
jgi:hypothetical protein